MGIKIASTSKLGCAVCFKTALGERNGNPRKITEFK